LIFPELSREAVLLLNLASRRSLAACLFFQVKNRQVWWRELGHGGLCYVCLVLFIVQNFNRLFETVRVLLILGFPI
jgi:hypothetical protein